jgi:hypothetical protein
MFSCNPVIILATSAASHYEMRYASSLYTGRRRRSLYTHMLG